MGSDSLILALMGNSPGQRRAGPATIAVNTSTAFAITSRTDPFHCPVKGHCVTVDLESRKSATMKTELLRFNGAVERDPAIDAWMKHHPGELGVIAHAWFEVI